MIRNISKRARAGEFFWRYGFNLRPSLAYRLGAAGGAGAAGGGAAAGMLAGLDRDGIAIARVEELLPDGAAYAALRAATDALRAANAERLAALKREAGDAAAIGRKTFNAELLGSTVEFDPASAFARFALDETLLAIADAYFGMRVKMRYYNVWQTFATRSAARESQLWHFDREDNYILKVFLYLNDVDAGAGPFTYAPGTHPKGARRAAAPEFFDEGGVRRSTDEQMRAAVPETEWITAVGRAGTLVLADTRGYHKGGAARASDRLMFTAMYTSPASQSKRLLKFGAPRAAAAALTKRQLAALEI